MGYAKERRPVLSRGQRTAPLSTAVSTGTTLQPGRTYTIDAPAADATWQLATPTALTKGSVTEVFINTNSTKVVTVQTASSAVTWFGSTNDRLAFSTGQGGVTARFVALSATKYAYDVTSRSTAAMFTASASTR